MSRSAVTLLSTVLILWCAYTWSVALSCDSCGRECASACGTRNFRTCCFNYLKKRSGPTSSGSGVRLELMMVVPELAQYYPSLKNLLPDSSEAGGQQPLYDNDVRDTKDNPPK